MQLIMNFCKRCKADFGEPCRTWKGVPRSPHKDRSSGLIDRSPAQVILGLN